MMDTSKSDIFWKNIKLSLSLSFLGWKAISANTTEPIPGSTNGISEFPLSLGLYVSMYVCIYAGMYVCMHVCL